jgi:hypothetical protein
MIMKMKSIKFSLLGILSLFLVFTACQDDFTEEDLLNLQAELAEKASANDHARALEVIAQQHANLLAITAVDQANELERRELSNDLAITLFEFQERLKQEIKDDVNAARAQEALDLLRASGFLVSYTIRTLDSEVPVSGASILLTAGVQQDTAITDIDGEAVFTDIPAVFIDVDASKTGFIGLSFTHDLTGLANTFKSVKTSDGTSIDVVDPEYDLVIVQLLPLANATELATIKGKVEGQLDLTKAGKEPFVGLPITATLSTAVGTSFIKPTRTLVGTLTDIAYSETSLYGRDTTDAKGEYEMVVPTYKPAGGADLMYSVTYPAEWTATQILASVTNDTANVVAVSTKFGTFLDQTTIGAPNVWGFDAVVNKAAAIGTGFAISAPTKVGRAIDGQTENWDTFLKNAVLNDRTKVGTSATNYSAIATLNNRGSGYTQTPRVTVTGNGTGTAATADFSLNYTIANLTTDSITAFGAGPGSFKYNNGVGNTVQIDVVAVTQNRTGTTAADTVVLYNDILTVPLTVKSDGSMDTTTKIQIANLVAANNQVTKNATSLDFTNLEDVLGQHLNSSIFMIYDQTTDTVGANATAGKGSIKFPAATTTLNNFTVTGGTGYTAPVFTFSGGGTGATLPSITVNVWETAWAFTINNAASAGYTTVPLFKFTADSYSAASARTVNTTAPIEISATVNATNINGLSSAGVTLKTDDFEKFLTDSVGRLVAQNNLIKSFSTSAMSLTAPALTILTTGTADANIFVNSADVSVTAGTTFGSISKLSGQNGTGAATLAAADRGKGYTGQLTISINARTIGKWPAGYTDTLKLVPTKAAVVTTSGYTTNSRSKVVTWDGSYNLGTSTGYIRNINVDGTTGVNFSITGGGTNNVGTAFTVTAGTVYIKNADYGTGVRDATVKIAGDTGTSN